MAKKKNEAKSQITASQIVGWFSDQRSTTAYAELFDQMEADFDLYSLKEYQAEKGHKAYTSPKPKNDFEKVNNGINKASLTWNIAVPESAPKRERDAANKGEQVLTGILAQADDQLISRDEPTLREGINWFGNVRGCVAVKCLIYNDEKGETVIDIQPWDPLHMAWERGARGYYRVGFEYTISKAEAKERYGKEISGNEAVVIDYFTETINAVVISDGGQKESKNEFIKEPAEHNLNHIPVFLGFAGSMPTVFNKNHEMQLKQRAKSVYDSSRSIYDPYNEQISFIADTAEKSVAGTLVYESETGEKSVSGDPYANWQVIRIKKDRESIHPLVTPRVPPESSMLMAAIDRDMQQSTVPYPAGYGLDPSAHSGAALAMLNDNTRSIYDPFASLIERAYRWLCKKILVQFKTKGKKITLQGINQDGKYYALDASPEDIRDDWFIQVKCQPEMPRDQAGEIQMALAATTPRPDGSRLLSLYTALEKIVKVQNPDAEIGRMDEEDLRRKINSIPEYTLQKMVLASVDAGDTESAKFFMSKLQELQAKQMPPGGGPVNPGPAPIPGGNPIPAGSPEGGINPAAAGMPAQAPGGPIPQLNPQQLEQIAQMASQLKAQGKPIPPEIIQALEQAG